MVFEDCVLGSCITGDTASLELLSKKHVIAADLASRGLHLACCNGKVQTAKWLHTTLGTSPTENTFLKTCVYGNVDVAAWLNDMFGFVPRKTHVALLCRNLIERASRIRSFVETPERYKIPDNYRDMIVWMSSFDIPPRAHSQEVYRVDPDKKMLALRISENVISLIKSAQ